VENTSLWLACFDALQASGVRPAALPLSPDHFIHPIGFAAFLLEPHPYNGRMITKDDVVEALHGVEDPELGMDIVEIGLFYDAEIDGANVKIIHSLTSMGCPAGPMIQEGIHDAVAELPGVDQVEVELTFDPPWTPDRMSDDAKFILGFG
jgi:metal-sulfur cluster biosynthetic enzyme